MSTNILTKEMLFNAEWRQSLHSFSEPSVMIMYDLDRKRSGLIVHYRQTQMYVNVEDVCPHRSDTNFQWSVSGELKEIFKEDWFKERYNMEINL